MKNILGIEPRESKPHRKEKSFSVGKTKLNESQINSYKINKSAIVIEDTKQKKITPLNFKISFIKKTYGKLQPFKQYQEASLQMINKGNFSKKLPLINSNINQVNNNLILQNENKLQIINKLNKKNRSCFSMKT